MAKKKVEKKLKWEQKAEWVGFVNYTPTDEDKKLIKVSWVPTPAQALDKYLRWVDEGYKVSTGWDTYSQCYQITLTGYYTDSPNPGLALSARHTDFNTAIGVLDFVVSEVFDNGPWEQDLKTQLAFDW